ncbi:MAG TPA: hypothetical protein VFU80_07245 [Sphingomicrobium sp.]|nr:hypothetical protein [Sphingomicrobium sp.]
MESEDWFGFVFSFYGLLLGLSVAVVLSSFARALKSRPKVRMGWLTALLGIFIILDVTSFWSGAWRARDWFAPEYGHLFIGLLVTGLYYFAASLVFPDLDQAKTEQDFDAHYFENRRRILLAVGFCNLALFGWQDYLELDDLPLAWWLSVPTYFALLIAAAIVRSRTLSIACLIGLIGIYLSSAALSIVWPWRG